MHNPFHKKLRQLCSTLRWPLNRRRKPKIIIKRLKNPNFINKDSSNPNGSATIHPNNQLGVSKSVTPIRIASFNAALFSMAPAVPALTKKGPTFDFFNKDQDSLKVDSVCSVSYGSLSSKSITDRPKSILKQSSLHLSSVSSLNNSLLRESKQQKYAKSKLRVSINLPVNEISLKRNGQMGLVIEDTETDPSLKIRKVLKGKGVLRELDERGAYRSTKSVVEVLRELDADILALQDVKAVEENDMKPLSDLAAALGMHYVFGESWAPEFGNAVLSKWPIKRSMVQKIFDESDFRFEFLDPLV